MGARSGTSNADARNARALGATIRALRAHAGLSQEALGKRAEIVLMHVGALERGEVPNAGLEPLSRVAYGLGVSLGVLAESYAAPPENGALRVDATKWPPPSRRPTGDATALGKAIRLIRQGRRLSQERLALEGGLHRNHLQSIEAGEKRNPSLASIARIARGLQGDAEEGPLPLLTRIFNGEATLADMRATSSSKPSGPSDAHRLPHAER